LLLGWPGWRTHAARAAPGSTATTPAHLVRGWLNRPDAPDFFERAAEVCGLYLDRPHNALVLSVDEKTAIAARSRKHPTRRCAPGLVERREFEDKRHGTACLMAALDVHSGQVLGTDAAKNDSAHFTGFLEEVDRAVHPDLLIHLVLDNGSSHVSKQTKTWLTAHPRFQAHYTPKHASWLNQVSELFFSILARRLLRRGEFASRRIWSSGSWRLSPTTTRPPSRFGGPMTAVR